MYFFERHWERYTWQAIPFASKTEVVVIVWSVCLAASRLLFHLYFTPDVFPPPSGLTLCFAQDSLHSEKDKREMNLSSLCSSQGQTLFLRHFSHQDVGYLSCARQGVSHKGMMFLAKFYLVILITLMKIRSDRKNPNFLFFSPNKKTKLIPDFPP